MTTRTELLNAFETKLDAEGSFLLPATGNTALPDGKSYVQEAYESLNGNHTVEWHFTVYWDAEADNVKKQAFYVKDRGTQDEEALWFKGNDPKPDDPPVTFREQLDTYLQNRIDDDTILHYSNVSANEATERGTATVILDQSGDLVERRIALWKDAQGNPQYQVIVE